VAFYFAAEGKDINIAALDPVYGRNS
jgi:hypothetical protein